MKKNVLVIEDDRDIQDLLELHLTELGYAVECCGDGEEGLKRALEGDYGLILLDLMLPKMDGLEICRRLRARSPFPMVLMLTAKTSELDRVLGLEMGADDYLTKPFSIQELLARVKALFRRGEAFEQKPEKAQEKTVELDGLSIDPNTRRVVKKGSPLVLTAKEFDLLLHFAKNPGRVYTREQLLENVWGYGHEGYEHTVNSHMNRLRAKLEDDPANPCYILTVWGVGYKFRDKND